MNDDGRRRWWTSNKELSPPAIALLAAFGFFGIFAIAVSVFDLLHYGVPLAPLMEEG